MIKNNGVLKSLPISYNWDNDFLIRTFTENDIRNFTDEYKSRISECYLEVWGESLKNLCSYAEAEENVSNLLNFAGEKNTNFTREIIVISRKREIVGFCGYDFYNDLSKGPCTPYIKNDYQDLLRKALQASSFWVYKVLDKHEPVILIKSMVLKKHYRVGLTPNFIKTMYARKAKEHPFTVVCVKFGCKSLNWFLGLGMYPLYNCPESEMIFLGGSSEKMLEVCESFINNNDYVDRYSEINENANKFFF